MDLPIKYQLSSLFQCTDSRIDYGYYDVTLQLMNTSAPNWDV